VPAVYVLVIFRRIPPWWFGWAIRVARQPSGGLVVVGILIRPPFVSSLFFVLGTGPLGNFICVGEFPCALPRWLSVGVLERWWYREDGDIGTVTSRNRLGESVSELSGFLWFSLSPLVFLGFFRTLLPDWLYLPGNRCLVRCELSVGKEIVLNSFDIGHY
jgi:hypothetical protein